LRVAAFINARRHTYVPEVSRELLWTPWSQQLPGAPTTGGKDLAQPPRLSHAADSSPHPGGDALLLLADGVGV